MFGEVTPKTLDGRQILTGQMFCELADSYVTALNSDVIPTISTAWERVIDAELRRVQSHAWEEIDTFMKDVVRKKFPIDERDLKRLLAKARLRALKAFGSQTVCNSPPEKLQEMRKAFEERFEEMCEVLNENNY